MNFLEPAGDYWIIETDYHNYSVVYFCAEFAWILSREKNLDPELAGHFTNDIL